MTIVSAGGGGGGVYCQCFRHGVCFTAGPECQCQCAHGRDPAAVRPVGGSYHAASD